MWHWINTHGFLVALALWGIAGIISCAPALPPNSGFFATWAYKVMQFIGASFDKMAHNSPYGQRLDSLEQVKESVASDGTTTSTRLKTTVTTVPAASTDTGELTSKGS